MTSPVDVTRLRALSAAATAGPWDWWQDGSGHGEMFVPNGTMSTETVLSFADYTDCEECHRPDITDAELIAESRNQLDGLLDEVVRLRASLDRVHALCDEYQADYDRAKHVSDVMRCGDSVAREIRAAAGEVR